MDGVWRFDSYNPTHYLGEEIKTRMKDDQIETLLSTGQNHTSQLKDHPYDPYLWRARGTTLAALGFPELALGDLWKAQLLCAFAREACTSHLMASRSHITNYCDYDRFSVSSTGRANWGDLALAQFADSYHKRKCKRNGSQVDFVETHPDELESVLTLFHVEIYDSLASILSRSGCFDDAVTLLRTACDQFQDHPAAVLLQDDLERCQRRLQEWLEANSTSSSSTKCSGLYTRRPYPWMDERYLERNEDVIADVQVEFGGAPPIPFRNCWFSPSPMSPAALIPSSQMCGVIAARDLSKGELVVADHFVFAGQDSHDFRPRNRVCSHCFSDIKTWTARFCPDCMTIHCSKLCAKWASTYHYALCGLDFTWLDVWARGSNLESRDPYANQVTLLVRFLAYAADNLDTAPMDNLYLSRFTAGYRPNPVTIPLSFIAMIVQPTRILENLGIDIFKDLRYDTWVIQVLLDRIIMNYGCYAPAGQGLPYFLGGLYSMFNHSCDPNLFNDPDSASYRVVPRLFARRDIKAGEELTMSYIKSGLPYNQRRQSLITWFDPCLCALCKEDREAAEWQERD